MIAVTLCPWLCQHAALFPIARVSAAIPASSPLQNVQGSAGGDLAGVGL